MDTDFVLSVFCRFQFFCNAGSTWFYRLYQALDWFNGPGKCFKFIHHNSWCNMRGSVQEIFRQSFKSGNYFNPNGHCTFCFWFCHTAIMGHFKNKSDAIVDNHLRSDKHSCFCFSNIFDWQKRKGKLVSYYQTRRHKHFDLLSSPLSSWSNIFINNWNSSSVIAENWLGRSDQIIDLRFDHRNNYRIFRKTQVKVEDLNLKEKSSKK